MAYADYLTIAVEWIQVQLLIYIEQKSTEPQYPATLERLNELTQQKAALAVGKPAPTFITLCELFKLSQFEENILLLCIAAELLPDMALLCQQIQGAPNPTFSLAMALFKEAHWSAISAQGALRYWCLLEINQPPDRPLTISPLRVDERIMAYLYGVSCVDDRLQPFLLPFDSPPNPVALPPSQHQQVMTALEYVNQTSGKAKGIVLQLLGPDTVSKTLIVEQLMRALQLQVYRLDPSMLPREPKSAEDFARLWHRETLLQSVALYIETDDIETETESSTAEGWQRLQRFIACTSGLFLLNLGELWHNTSHATIAIEVHKPTPREQLSAWQAILPPTLHQASISITAQFNLNLPIIYQLGRNLPADTIITTDELFEQLWMACLHHTRPRMEQLAQRIIPKAKWDDIVLPDTQRQLLYYIASQVHHRNMVYETWGFRKRYSRGLGMTVLFAGESGTGKTMAAEILANHLNLNLYRIDLSSVVSKYIGETEKNLRKLFDAAENGGAILFFDEADAIFGKRGEVKDSHDRYANIEVNYLLQRMEAYQGLAILATNLKSGLDDAFTRRLRFSITFSKPDEAQRTLIWQKVFPPETPLGELDYGFLAQKFKLTGGSIYNIALNAAFFAAHLRKPVNMPFILEAIRAELSKEDRLLNEKDFIWSEVTNESSQSAEPEADQCHQTQATSSTRRARKRASTPAEYQLPRKRRRE